MRFPDEQFFRQAAAEGAQALVGLKREVVDRIDDRVLSLGPWEPLVQHAAQVDRHFTGAVIGEAQGKMWVEVLRSLNIEKMPADAFTRGFGKMNLDQTFQTNDAMAISTENMLMISA